MTVLGIKADFGSRLHRILGLVAIMEGLAHAQGIRHRAIQALGLQHIDQQLALQLKLGLITHHPQLTATTGGVAAKILATGGRGLQHPYQGTLTEVGLDQVQMHFNLFIGQCAFNIQGAPFQSGDAISFLGKAVNGDANQQAGL